MSAPRRLLLANRGEVAVRVARAASRLGIASVAVFARDDAGSLHVHSADEAHALPGAGAAAYLDAGALVDAARATGCDAVHPGWGFLAESADFARRCEAAGLAFVGPTPDTLARFGDKLAARAEAERLEVPVLAGTRDAASADDVRALLASPAGARGVVVKAVHGGGGRGMRVVQDASAVDEALARCRSEAAAAFGSPDVYAEPYVPRARHVEVQALGDGAGGVVHLGERECSLQRRHQKLVEIAPAPALERAVRDALFEAALALARATRLRSLATFEFLVASDGGFFFIEANPRLQVEHTVTEEVTGLDLVALQLRVAGGETLAQLGLETPPAPRGFAVQARVNAERVGEDGSVRPASGVLTAFEAPSGPGVRVDAGATAGTRLSPHYDSLLAKVIGRDETYPGALARAARALSEFRIEGAATNIAFLQSLLRHPDVSAARLHTRFVDEHAAALVAEAERQPRRWAASAPGAASGRAGALVDAGDPLAVLAHGKREAALDADAAATFAPAPEGLLPVLAPLQGTVASIEAAEGALVARGAPLFVMEAMKMEHVVATPAAGVVRQVLVAKGETLLEGHPLAYLEVREGAADGAAAEAPVDLARIRPDLAESLARHAVGLDAARPAAVARRRRTGQRTARENVDDLVDARSFVEYGPLVIAAQRRRRALDDLVANTPADGLVAGIGRVNGDLFGPERSRCAVLSYDYTVLAGTQGQMNHRKKDRLFELAEQYRLPIVFFTEGGGGRPGDTDGVGVAGLDCWAFHEFARLSGLVPLVGVNSGRCFAGNAALLGCCDVVIATANSNIGMGGPAMIEGGGLGVFRPEEVGPMSVQAPNGVVDVAVADEAEAVAVAKRYLAYFQGSLPTWEAADQRLLRHAVPENRLRVYDVRRVIATLADTGSVLELRRRFGAGMVTALARVEGRPLGIVANDPAHLGGAIDSDGSDKAARFLQLCDAFDLPVVFLCDTPGMMVGPEVEKTALVRHCSRLFVVGANLTVPYVTIVLRKMYGLGGQAMAGGSTKAPLFTVAWPTGEFGGMGLEGSVKLGYRKELAAISDPAERRAKFEEMVARAYEHGKAINTASHFEIDDVIDPADSRRWIATALASAPPPAPRTGKKRPCVDAW